MMLAHACLIVMLLMLLNGSTALRAQTQSAASGGVAAAPNGVIAGRVTIGANDPAPGVTIVLLPVDYGPRRQPAAKAVTDADGSFRMTGVNGGRYRLSALAPSLVSSDATRRGGSGKLVTIADGETIEGINLRLERGGVITGRVNDAEGRPVIGEYVQLTLVDENNQPTRSPFLGNPFRFMTDDRGVYRIYGLPAGRYLVSVGEAREGGMVRFGTARAYYSRTFHPSATDQAEAKVIEVTPGTESANVDIKLHQLSETFQATGRVVDDGSGKPVPNVMFGYGSVDSRGGENRVGAYGYTGRRTDTSGNFHIEGLRPGRYAAFAVTEGESESYSEPAVFEINDKDVAGLEIKIRSGSSLSGVVIVEGTSDGSVLAKLSQLQLSVDVSSTQVSAPRSRPIPISADGSFRVPGLSPGKARFWLPTYLAPTKGFSLRRVELNGVEQPEGVEVGPNQQITGLRVVLAYGTSVVRGRIKVEGGELPTDVIFMVNVNHLDGKPVPVRPSEVDARGQFVIEGLAAGQYKIRLGSFIPNGGRPSPRLPPSEQIINVADGGVMEVTLTLNLSEQVKEGTAQ